MTETGEFPAESIAELLRSAVPGAVIKDAPWIDMPAIVVDREHVVDVCRALRDEAALQFSFLADLTVVDNHPAEPRFDVVYSLVCVGAAFAQAGGAAPARRLRMKVRLPAHETHIPTVTGIYPAAGWLEREAFDLFGVIFDGHPDLRRLLMADDWEGHPLRKDYAVQIRKDTSSWSAIQMTPEQFAANIQAARDRVRTESDSEGPKV